MATGTDLPPSDESDRTEDARFVFRVDLRVVALIVMILYYSISIVAELVSILG